MTVNENMGIDVEPTEPKIKINNDLPVQHVSKITLVIHSSEKPVQEVKYASDVILNIELASDKIVNLKPGRISFSEREQVIEITQDLSGKGIIRIVRKKNCELRL